MRCFARVRNTEMLTRLVAPLAAAVIIATPVAAYALTVTNRDKLEHTLFILEQDDEWTATVQPGKTLRNLCSSPCSIGIDPDQELDLRGNEAVELRDGKLVVRPPRKALLR
jgi:hypothetical protein